MGFHDSANSIATVLTTRVLSPKWAVVWAAFFNFIAFLVFGTRAASNIAKGIDPHALTLGLIAAAFVGAILWDLLTWWWGLPASSSHALMGGMAGAALVKVGPHRPRGGRRHHLTTRRERRFAAEGAEGAELEIGFGNQRCRATR